MWNKILKEFSENPRDVHTTPKVKKEPKWFLVYEEYGNIYIEKARSHEPSSSIQHRLRLKKEEIEIMKNIYDKRNEGESVSHLATKSSWMSVYWYGIFAEMNL